MDATISSIIDEQLPLLTIYIQRLSDNHGPTTFRINMISTIVTELLQSTHILVPLCNGASRQELDSLKDLCHDVKKLALDFAKEIHSRMNQLDMDERKSPIFQKADKLAHKFIAIGDMLQTLI
jgi:hypothetical protein